MSVLATLLKKEAQFGERIEKQTIKQNVKVNEIELKINACANFKDENWDNKYQDYLQATFETKQLLQKSITQFESQQLNSQSYELIKTEYEVKKMDYEISHRKLSEEQQKQKRLNELISFYTNKMNRLRQKQSQNIVQPTTMIETQQQKKTPYLILNSQVNQMIRKRSNRKKKQSQLQKTKIAISKVQEITPNQIQQLQQQVLDLQKKNRFLTHSLQKENANLSKIHFFHDQKVHFLVVSKLATVSQKFEKKINFMRNSINQMLNLAKSLGKESVQEQIKRIIENRQ